MNREIKFRAWVKSEQRMTPSFDFRQWDGNYLYPSNFGKVMFGDLEIMQFTGLLDKNGKEIYEGDIVKHYGFGNSWIVTFGEYKRDNFENRDNQQKHLGFYGKPISNYDEKNDIEWNGKQVSLLGEDFRNGIVVIGNIFENPDLIK